MKKNRFVQLALALGLVFATGAPAFSAREGKDISKFKEQLQKEANVSSQDAAAIEPELREYTQRNGDPKQLSEVAKTAVQNNCTGNCLGETLRAMNSAMAKGLSDRDAQSLVSQALREQVQARNQGIITEQELGSRVRARVDEQLGMAPGSPIGPAPAAPEAPGGMPGGTSGGGR
ncbi:MAG: hypothetical protein Q7T24_00705 [Deltaproteobacteria bacterium]|nr:hypothetical protein [Deltaproteobacteria bacterium]